MRRLLASPSHLTLPRPALTWRCSRRATRRAACGESTRTPSHASIQRSLAIACGSSIAPVRTRTTATAMRFWPTACTHSSSSRSATSHTLGWSLSPSPRHAQRPGVLAACAATAVGRLSDAIGQCYPLTGASARRVALRYLARIPSMVRSAVASATTPWVWIGRRNMW